MIAICDVISTISPAYLFVDRARDRFPRVSRAATMIFSLTRGDDVSPSTRLTVTRPIKPSFPLPLINAGIGRLLWDRSNKIPGDFLPMFRKKTKSRRQVLYRARANERASELSRVTSERGIIGSTSIKITRPLCRPGGEKGEEIFRGVARALLLINRGVPLSSALLTTRLLREAAFSLCRV